MIRRECRATATTQQVRDRAIGNWPAILAGAGIDLVQLDVRTKKTGAACPLCGGTDRYYFDDHDSRGGWRCRRCTPQTADGWTLLMRFRDWSFVQAKDFVADFLGVQAQAGPAAPAPRAAPPKAAPVMRTTLSQYGIDLFASCVPLAGTVGEAYLRARRCVIPPADGDLRFHPALEHKPTGYVGPALVALITDALTGKPRSLHRTWITPTGKAAVDPPRMTLANHETTFSVIRLWPDEYVTTGFGIGEGIESTLSLAHAFRPVWACLNAGNLAAFPVLPGIECLMIAADHDQAGIDAGEACAARWVEAGREVRLVLPDSPGDDLNDVALGDA